PLVLAGEGLDTQILRCLKLQTGERNMQPWAELVERVRHPVGQVDIGLVGKYVGLQDSYKSLSEAFAHAGFAHNVKVNLLWIEAEGLEDENWERQLERLDAVLVPGGFGKRGIPGMLRGIRFARTRKVP